MACNLPGIRYLTNTASPASRWNRKSCWLRSVRLRYSATIWRSRSDSFRLTSYRTASHHCSCWPSSFSSTLVSSISPAQMLSCSPQAPQWGDYLKTRRYGEYPNLVGSILRPAAISPKNSVHANSAPAATTNFLSPSLMTLLYRSTRPLARGWAL